MNSKVWKIFKKYYLIDSIIYGLLFTFIGISISLEKNWSFKFSFIYFGIVIPLIIFISGSFGYFKYEISRPRKIKNYINSQLFSDFKWKNGFKRVDNKYIGRIDNYVVKIGIEWKVYQSKPTYFSKVIFNPLSKNRYLSFFEYEKFNDIELERENFYITLNNISKTYTKVDVEKLKHETLLKEISKMIEFLKSKNLFPIEINSWEKTSIKSDDLEEEYLFKV